MAEGFEENAVVILNLVNPREKFWGVLLSLTPVGATLRGINLDSFEDWVRQVARGDEEDQNIDLVSMFVPLFRVERIFLDEPVGAVRSYSQFFEEIIGLSPRKFLGYEKIKTEEVS